MTFTGIPLKANGNYKIVADEEESDIDATFIENFFKQVPIDLPAEATVLKAKKK